MIPPLARQWWLRWTVRAVQVVAAVAFVYVVAINALLATPLLRAIVARELGTDLSISYARAYCLIPGRVHVTRLSLRGSDSHVQWLVQIDEASFGVHPLSLLRRKFRATHVDASGVVVRVRMLESRPDARHDADVPPIPGFTDPPLKPIGPPTTVLDDAYNLFTIDLEDVSARGVREVWIDSIRLTGDWDVRGRWYFRPLRLLAVGPASVELRALEISEGPGRSLLTAAHGHLDATVAPYDVRIPSPRETMRFVSARVELGGVLRSVELFRTIPLPRELEAPAGDASIAAAFAVEGGVLQAGSRAELAPSSVSMRVFGTEVHAVLSAVAHVDAHADDGGGVVTAGVDVSLRDTKLGAPTAPDARVDLVQGTLVTTNVDLATPPEDGRYIVDASGLAAAHLDPWSRLTSGAATVTSGAAQAHGHLAGSFRAGPSDAALSVRIAQLRGLRGGVSVAGDLTADVVATFDGASARGSLSAALDGASVVEHDLVLSGRARASAEPWQLDWTEGLQVRTGVASVLLNDLALRDARGGAAGRVIGRVSEVSASTTGLELDARGRAGLVAVKLVGGVMPDVRELSRAVRLPAAVHVEGGAAGLRAQGDVDLGTATVSGSAALDVKALSVRGGSSSMVGDVSLVVSARRRGKASTLVATRLALDHVAGVGGSEWWAHAYVEDGEIERTPQGWRGRMEVAVHARDAKPVDSVVASLSGVPAWVLGVFALPDLQARGELLFTPHTVAVRGLEAHGGDTAVRLEVAKDALESRGLVLARHGDIEVGLGLGAETPRFQLLGAGPWFERRRALMEQAMARW